MQVDQHIRNLKFLRSKVGKAKTPKDHEKIGKEVTEAIKKLGCNPDKIFYTINSNKVPNLSVKKAVRTRVGTKKIGEGEYGEIFFGCVDKECKKDIAIKIQQESLKSEYKIGKMLNKLGGVTMYALETCGKRNIMYSEYVNGGALEDYIKKNITKLRPIHFRFIITDVLYNLYRIHKKYPSFRHSDLHAKNILINTDTPTLEKTEMKIDTITLKVEDVGIKTLLTDYGLSSTSTIKNPTTKGLDREWGISPKSHPMYDAHLFLNALFLICVRLNTESVGETIRFIQRILPREYLGNKTNKIENFRLRLNADHSDLPTFKKIFADRFFVPYRLKITERSDPLSFIPKAKPIPKIKKIVKPKQVATTSQSAAMRRAKAVMNKERAKAVVNKRKSPPIKVAVAPKGYVRVNGKKCTTYKKKDIVELAKKAGVDTQGKTIEKICESLKLKYVK
jgi:tRNA A-37 threonylcarbamoyl transferase component Bud32